MKLKAPSESPSYITPQGYQKLNQELDYLWKVERPRVTKGVTEAAAEGDRSENAEYIYGKKRLREIDRRIRFLSKRLDVLTVVEIAPPRQDRVFFGAWVTVETDEEDEKVYRIVGPDESDAEQGFISVESPMAKALLGKDVGDSVRVQRPRGMTEVTVVAIRY